MELNTGYDLEFDHKDEALLRVRVDTNFLRHVGQPRVYADGRTVLYTIGVERDESARSYNSRNLVAIQHHSPHMDMWEKTLRNITSLITNQLPPGVRLIPTKKQDLYRQYVQFCNQFNSNPRRWHFHARPVTIYRPDQREFDSIMRSAPTSDDIFVLQSDCVVVVARTDSFAGCANHYWYPKSSREEKDENESDAQLFTKLQPEEIRQLFKVLGENVCAVKNSVQEAIENNNSPQVMQQADAVGWGMLVLESVLSLGLAWFTRNPIDLRLNGAERAASLTTEQVGSTLKQCTEKSLKVESAVEKVMKSTPEVVKPAISAAAPTVAKPAISAVPAVMRPTASLPSSIPNDQIFDYFRNFVNPGREVLAY